MADVEKIVLSPEDEKIRQFVKSLDPKDKSVIPSMPDDEVRAIADSVDRVYADNPNLTRFAVLDYFGISRNRWTTIRSRTQRVKPRLARLETYEIPDPEPETPAPPPPKQKNFTAILLQGSPKEIAEVLKNME